MKKWLILLIFSMVLFPILGIVGGGAVAYVTPKEYQSSATIQLPPPREPLLSNVDHSARFIATEATVITSDATLEIAVEDLDLTSAWALPREMAVKRLRKAIKVKVIQGTDLIEITGRSNSPEEARKITDHVVSAYSSRKRFILSRQQDQALGEIRDAIQNQEDLIEDKRRTLLTIQKNLAGKDEMSSIEQMTIADAESDFETSKRLLEQLKLKETTMKIEHRMSAEAITLHSEPRIPLAPSGPNIQLHFISGFLIGIVAGLLLPALLLPFFLLGKRKNKPVAG
ncbi:MAG: Wzz/FepE/Etk N-terminal domain-containing protein [Verrucomicrobiota bacterium]